MGPELFKNAGRWIQALSPMEGRSLLEKKRKSGKKRTHVIGIFRLFEYAFRKGSMAFSDHIFQNIEDGVDLRQGDVICREMGDGGTRTFGVIITADCDIAQGKVGEYLSYLEIISAGEYIATLWAADELRGHSDKQLNRAVEGMNAALRRRNMELSPMTKVDALNWLKESTVEAIAAAVQGDAKKDDWPGFLQIVQIAEGLRESAGVPFARLVQVWDSLGISEKKRKERIYEALNSNKQQDIVFVPSLPVGEDIGFIVLLRAMRSIRRHEIHLSVLDAKLSGKPYEFHRIGRFSDTVRHSISQRMAFLFSRIGLSPAYEDDSRMTKDLFVDGFRVANLTASK